MIDKNGAVHVVIFRLLDEELAVEVSAVREITRLTKIAQLLQPQDSIEGVINIKGHIVPVMDLRKRFGLQALEMTEKTRIMIVRVKGMNVGLILDAVVAVRIFSKEMLHPVPALLTTRIHHRYISKIARWSDQVIMLLNLEEILTGTETDVLKAGKVAVRTEPPADSDQDQFTKQS